MASIKVKYRPSSQNGKKGTIYYQVIHHRTVRQIKTNFHILADQWDNLFVVSTPPNPIAQRIAWDERCLKSIVLMLENRHTEYTTDDIVNLFGSQNEFPSFFCFMREVICQLISMDKIGTAEAYKAAFKSFMLFLQNKDLLFDEINSDLMQMYEAYLHERGVTDNSSSFYMRILRAVYNRAVEKGLTQQSFPFKHVYTGVSRTIKRAIQLSEIKKIKNLDLEANPVLDFARDMFLFSFYTRGMSFVDMANLKKNNLKYGVLTYRRRKTKQQLSIKWESCMQQIVDKHKVELDSPYLLPILSKKKATRNNYKNMLFRVNKHLKEIAPLVNILTPLTLYVARHSWASIAKKKNIPISVISEGLGHESEKTTQIYLASLDNSVVDKANNFILKDL